MVTAVPEPIVLTPIARPARQPFPARRLVAWSLVALAVIGFVALVAVGVKSVRNLIADMSNREPTAEWARTAPLEKMAAAFGKGALLRFDPKEVAIMRESTGVAHVTMKGSAITRGALYEGVANEDSAVLPESKLADWRKARERASFLRQRAGSDLAAVDERPFQFIRETTAAGKTVEFQFQFKARREGNDWRVDRVVATDLMPADALRGKAISEFSSPAILGTDKANRDKRLFSEAIDKYIAEVSKANAQAIKRFAKDGRDADGNPLFPAEAMAGERFAQTRMRILQSSDIQNWSGEDVQYAINEMFARHGFIFEDKKIASMFSKLSWYRPRRDLSRQQIDDSLSDMEVENVRTLLSVIVARKEEAERARRAAIAQQKQQEATLAQQKAEADAKTQEAVIGIIGGILQAIGNHRK
jgi:YARHG domain-containing protein